MTLKIIGGKFKNRSLKAPLTPLSKPTMSLVRKSFFDIVQLDIEGANFLDVFACSGAIGLEAISRGAATATFIDQDRKAIRCIEDNIKTLQLESQCKVLCQDALKALKMLERGNAVFSLVYLDPPYIHADKKECSPSELLFFFDSSNLLEKGGKLFIEEGGSSSFDPKSLPLKNLVFKNSRKFSCSHMHQFEKLH